MLFMFRMLIMLRMNELYENADNSKKVETVGNIDTVCNGTMLRIFELLNRMRSFRILGLQIMLSMLGMLRMLRMLRMHEIAENVDKIEKVEIAWNMDNVYNVDNTENI